MASPEAKMITLSASDSGFLMEVLSMPSTSIQVDVAKIAGAQGKSTKAITNKMSAIRTKYGMIINCVNSGKTGSESHTTPKNTPIKERASAGSSRKRKAESSAGQVAKKGKRSVKNDEDDSEVESYEIEGNESDKDNSTVKSHKKKPVKPPFKLEPTDF